MSTTPIKFKGYHTFKDHGAWVYGYYFYFPETEMHSIFIPDGSGSRVIDPKSLGQLAWVSNGIEYYKGDIVKINRDGYENEYGAIKQLDGGQFYIDHDEVMLKYKHQIHCEVCECESPLFFLQYFESYELEIIGNAYNPNEK